MHYSIFEILMLVCFGFSWPLSILKTLRSPSVEGKSVPFMIIVIVGYCAGIVHKVLYSRDFVIALYALNAAMVAVDLALTVAKGRRVAQAS